MNVSATKYSIGDSCLCWSVGVSISIPTTRIVLSVYHSLKNDGFAGISGIYDIVPSYTAVAVHYDPLITDVGRLEAVVDHALRSAVQTHETSNQLSLPGGKVVELPVLYNGADVERVAQLNALTVKEVVKRHHQSDYTVAMVGFRPHFPYLIGLDKSLETPRLETPRKVIPAGSVAIGGAQTGIYPEESPGGWNLLGMTHPELLTEIEPGDRVRFREVDSL